MQKIIVHIFVNVENNTYLCRKEITLNRTIMKKLFNYFSFMVIMAITTFAFASCSNGSEELDDINDKDTNEIFEGHWTFESRTVEGNATIAEAIPHPSWMEFDGRDKVTYEYKGNVINGEVLVIYSKDEPATLGLYANLGSADPDDILNSCSFTVVKMEKNRMTLLIEGANMYMITLTYTK